MRIDIELDLNTPTVPKGTVADIYIQVARMPRLTQNDARIIHECIVQWAALLTT